MSRNCSDPAKVFLVGALLLMGGYCQADEALSYDPNGNILSRATPSGTTTYQYDDLDRVIQEAGPTKTQAISWDANGNRTGDASGTHTYTGSSNRQLTIAGQSVTLDASGNITQARNLGFVWNSEGQLAEVRQGNPTGPLLASYTYDHQGRRTRKVKSGSLPVAYRTTIYTYDQYGRLSGEFNGTGAPLRTYVWRDAVPLAVIIHGGMEAVFYLETDHLGSPIAARDKDGTVVWRWVSDAFGAALPNEDADGDGNLFTLNLRFPGQYYDAESGLHYNWHRYYDPKVGRYLSSDPVGLAGGLNTYSYVLGNPISYSDPLGLETQITIWQPVGWWSSSFGHVSTNINGTTYSWGPNGMWTGLTSTYLNQNSFRSGVALGIKLSPNQEKEFEGCMQQGFGKYNSVLNNCGGPAQFCLSNVGVNLDRSVLPMNFGQNLLDSGWVNGIDFYTPSVPAEGGTAPWAR